MTTFQCKIVTPADAVLDEEVQYVSFQAFDGQQGVLAGASPFLSQLGAGVCRVDRAAGSTEYLLNGGFAQMNKNTLVLLADGAELVTSINLEQALKQVSEADARVGAVNEKALTLEQREGIERAQSLARARVAASRRR
ncbi:MAG: F0F1 ATP synthase subunit epsilon [Phycisphaerales bacterium]|nr:F0F1 ATP synthase subunit epsilon [Phycisphaerales bacterium]